MGYDSMRRLGWGPAAFAAGAAALFSLGLRTRAAPGTPRPATPAAAFEQVVSLLDRHYFDPTYGGLEWEGLCGALRQRMARTPGRTEQYRLIVSLLGRLRHSHLRFMPPPAYAGAVGKSGRPVRVFPMGRERSLDFRLCRAGNQVVVAAVDEGGLSWRHGLRPGFVLHKLDGIEVRSLSGEQFPAAAIRQLLFRYPRDRVLIAGIDHRSRIRSLELPLFPYLGETLRFGRVEAPGELVVDLRDDGILYLRFNIFLFPLVAKVKQAIQENRSCRGVVLDLRDNPGGIGLLAVAVAAEFAGSPYCLGTQIRGTEELRYPVYPVAEPCLAPLVLLVNSATASTAEILARGLQARRRAAVVGTLTAGMALPSVVTRLCDGSTLQYPVADFRDPAGVRLEGIGVIPNFTEKLTVQGLRTGVDTQMARAVRVVDEIDAAMEAGSQQEGKE